MPESGKGSETSHLNPAKVQKHDLLLPFSPVSGVEGSTLYPCEPAVGMS